MINQDELIKGTLKFIDELQRLPYLNGDEVEVEKANENNETELKYYRSNKYIKEYFGTQDKYTKFLIDSGHVSYETISKSIGIDMDRLTLLLSGKVKKLDTKERRAIHIFFNKDYYSKMDKYSNICMGCKSSKKCGQDYWVDVISCDRYKKKIKYR